MSPRRPICALASLALVAACSREPQPAAGRSAGESARESGEDSAARASVIELETRAPGPQTAPTGARLALPAQLAPWSVRGSPAQVAASAPGAGAEPCLRIAGQGRWLITIPGRSALGEFEALALVVRADSTAKLSLAVGVRSGARSERSATDELELTGAGSGTLRCALPELAHAAERIDELELELAGDAGSGAALQAPVLAFRLPRELSELSAELAPAARPLLLGDEHRPARILEPGRRMLGRALAPADGARLVLGFGAFEFTRGDPRELALIVRIRSEGAAPRTEHLAIETRGRWQTRELALGLRAGERFELQCELECPLDAYALGALAVPVVYAPASTPPTVVLITSDTHRGDHLEGVPGAVAIRTPALLALAGRGVVFDDCYASANITLPSHVALLTGTHPLDSGVTDNRTTLIDAATTLTELFQAAGWHTCAATSSNLLSPNYSGAGQGFERMSSPLATRVCEPTIDDALRFLDEAPQRPVFCWVHLFDAHGPYQPPPPFERAFYPQGKDPTDPSIALEPGMRVPPYRPKVRDAEFIRALYRGEIGYEDAQLARLFAHPRVRAGVVAFTGDHGEVLGKHGIWWAHKDVYPDTLRVPLILAWPGAPQGLHVAAPVSNIDLGRTLLDLAGLSASAFPGRDLARLGAPPVASARFALSGGCRAASINSGGWHLILQLRDDAEDDPDGHVGQRALHQVELFHVAEDPGCERELVAAEPARAADLRGQLVTWLGAWRGARWGVRTKLDGAALRNLAALGYASGEGGAVSDGPLIDPSCSCAWCARWR